MVILCFLLSILNLSNSYSIAKGAHLRPIRRFYDTEQIVNESSEATRKDTSKLLAAQEKVLTLKAYIDEAERELFLKNWENLQIYLNVITLQDTEFALLIDELFPSENELDKFARDSMLFEAQTMFLALDDLREASKDGLFQESINSYAKMLLSYDRFLKAGNLYPTYDLITSTEVFFRDTPRNTLKFDAKSKVRVQDAVVLTSGPDMGKLGTVIYVDDERKKAIIKLDKDGRPYQEVKLVQISMLARAVESENVHTGAEKKKKQK